MVSREWKNGSNSSYNIIVPHSSIPYSAKVSTSNRVPFKGASLKGFYNEPIVGGFIRGLNTSNRVPFKGAP